MKQMWSRRCAGLATVAAVVVATPSPDLAETVAALAIDEGAKHRSSVAMKADVPMSITSGSLSVGKPNATGLVPSTRAVPPKGATLGGDATVWIVTSPARAIISQ